MNKHGFLRSTIRFHLHRNMLDLMIQIPAICTMHQSQDYKKLLEFPFCHYEILPSNLFVKNKHQLPYSLIL